MLPPMLRWEVVECRDCGILFERLITQVDRVLCADCRPRRRNPPVKRRR